MGFEISESTVSRYLAQGTSSPDSNQRWLTFLKNHREALAAMDFFTVPTATFRVLYCFFVISHGRRKILHFNVTEHPTGAWIVQQLREAFPEDRAPQYLILDRDVKFSGEVATMLEYLGSELIRAYRSPWQNGVPPQSPCARRQGAAFWDSNPERRRLPLSSSTLPPYAARYYNTRSDDRYVARLRVGVSSGSPAPSADHCD